MSNTIPHDSHIKQLERLIHEEEVMQDKLDKEISDLEPQILALKAAMNTASERKIAGIQHIRELRKACFPARRIPVEIIARIFRYIYIPQPPSFISLPLRKRYLYPTQICTGWRRVALGMPELWSHVYIKRKEGHMKHIDVLLKHIWSRSTARPLSLALDVLGPDTMTVPDLAPVSKLIKRVHKLDITLPSFFINKLLESSREFTFLRHLIIRYKEKKSVQVPVIADALRVSRLEIHSPCCGSDLTLMTFPWSRLRILDIQEGGASINVLLTILSECSELTQLLTYIVAENSRTPRGPSSAIAPLLKCLVITDSLAFIPEFIGSLKTPSLTKLEIVATQTPSYEESMDGSFLIPFLSRSKCSLTTFHCGEVLVSDNVLLRFLRKLPNLSDLCLSLVDDLHELEDSDLLKHLSDCSVLPLYRLESLWLYMGSPYEENANDVYVPLVESICSIVEARWKPSQGQDKQGDNNDNCFNTLVHDGWSDFQNALRKRLQNYLDQGLNIIDHPRNATTVDENI